MNLKVAQKHAEDAVRLAKKSNAHQGVIESYRLLIEIYDCLGNERRAKDVVHESIKYAEANLGPGSPEFAEQLAFLAEYEVDSKPEKAEQLMRRYVGIMEINGDNDRTFHAYAAASEFFMMNEKPAISETFQLKTFALAKQIFGPFCEDLPNSISYYVETLYELGRDEEARSLGEANFRCFHADMFNDELAQCLREKIATVSGGAENFCPQAEREVSEFDCSLNDLRAAVDELGRSALLNASKIETNDLFLEVRQKAEFASYYFAKQQLGLATLHAARAKNDRESMLDAALMFKELSEECLGNRRNCNLYVLAMLELARLDETFGNDADIAIDSLPKGVERLYLKGLRLFLINGDSTETREALREAVVYNDLVLRALECVESVSDRNLMRDGLQEDWKKRRQASLSKSLGIFGKKLQEQSTCSRKLLPILQEK